MKAIEVLAVDDSALTRESLTGIVNRQALGAALGPLTQRD